MNNLPLRREIIKAAQRFNSTGLSASTSGNVSARTKHGFLITPMSVEYEKLQPGSLVELDTNGKKINGRFEPSSEWRFHKDIYDKRAESRSIVHVHSPFATAIACTRKPIPAFHYLIALAGGDSIRCAQYATFGTQALSRNALKALKGRSACLLANHGQIAIGDSVASALTMAQEVEELARHYCLSKMAGKPVLLNKNELSENQKKIMTYRKQSD